MPSLSTIKRVISFINPKELKNILVEAVKRFNDNNKHKPLYQLGLFKIEDSKTIDGKTANDSDRKKSKNGEITTCPKLLERLNIKNNIVTFDALNPKKETIEYIFNNDGYYVAPIKGNHKTLYEELCDYFSDEEFFNKVKKENYIKTIEKRNGDAEIREYCFTNDIEWIYNKSEWLRLKSVGFAKRTYKNF